MLRKFFILPSILFVSLVFALSVMAQDDVEIIATLRAGQMLLPHPDTILQAEDRVLAIISPQARERFERQERINQDKETTMSVEYHENIHFKINICELFSGGVICITARIVIQYCLTFFRGMPDSETRDLPCDMIYTELERMRIR